MESTISTKLDVGFKEVVSAIQSISASQATSVAPSANQGYLVYKE